MGTNNRPTPGPSAADFDVVGANRLLTEHNLALARELQQRASPRVGELVDCLNMLTNNAKAGNLAAKQVLKKLHEAWQASLAAASGIELPDGMVPSPAPVLQQDGHGELPDTDEPAEGGNVL